MTNMLAVEISIEAIERDIKLFKERVKQTQDKLAGLPESAGAYRGRKKLKMQKQSLEQEIRHVEKLIQIAQQGILARRNGTVEKKHTSQSARF